MKQATKVLLPLGLFMSIVIPITVKSMFSETNFFEADNSKSDYIQPYNFRPENEEVVPKVRMGENGLELDVIEASVAAQAVDINSDNSVRTMNSADNGKMTPPDSRKSGSQKTSSWSRSSR
jgi:hypothetical protein